MQTKSATDTSVNDVYISRLDAETRQLAKNLDKLQFIYALYGSLDGLSLSYSMIKYCFDVSQSDSHFSSSRNMHDWMATPEGMLFAATESITLITFSFLANVYGDNDKNAFKRYIAIAWPYCRDAMKGLKNAYKGIRSTLQTIGLVSGQDLYYMIIPAGLIFGALSVLNRFWMRKYVKEPRILMMKANAQLLEEIKATPLYVKTDFPLENALGNKSLYKNSYILVGGEKLFYINSEGCSEDVTITDSGIFSENMKVLQSKTCEKEIQPNLIERVLYLSDAQASDLITNNGGYRPPVAGLNAEDCELLRRRKQSQLPHMKSLGLLSAAYGGFVDGLYLYIGVLGLALLSSPVFIAMAVCCFIFSTACIVVRLYEEKDYQRRLEGTEAKIELALCAKQIEAIWGELERFTNPSNTGITDNQIKEDVKKAQVLKLTHTLTEFNAKRQHLFNLVTLSDTSAMLVGLRNGMAAYAAITSLIFAISAVNAIFLIPFSSSLLIFTIVSGMVFLIGFTLHACLSNSADRQKREQEVKVDPLADLLNGVNISPIEKLRDTAPKEIKKAIFSRFYFQEWFEVVRSFGSGLSKGPKAADFLQNMSEGIVSQHEDPHDVPVMLQISLFSGVFHSVVFALRAFARGFGRDAPDVVRNTKLRKPTEPLPLGEELVPQKVPAIQGPEPRTTGLSFFDKKNKALTPPPSPSPPLLNPGQLQDETILMTC